MQTYGSSPLSSVIMLCYGSATLSPARMQATKKAARRRPEWGASMASSKGRGLPCPRSLSNIDRFRLLHSLFHLRLDGIGELGGGSIQPILRRLLAVLLRHDGGSGF